MRVLTAEQMREVDRLTTERYGLPSLQLMENAGARLVEFLAGRYQDLKSRRIAVLCGKGNNGGDGFAVARLLQQMGAKPAVYLFSPPESVQGDAAINLKRWRDVGGNLRIVTTTEQWQRVRPDVIAAELIVDALLGTGLRGPVEGLLRAVIDDVNSIGDEERVVAVDIPSGLSSDATTSAGPAIRAGATVTFTAPKVGQLFPPNAEHVGKLVVVSIGTPGELLDDKLFDGGPAGKLRWLETREFRWLPVHRQPDGHKGTYGHVLVVAGSWGKSGAAVLAGTAALRVGAGLVTVATPASVLPIVASHTPELMTEPLEATEAGTISLRSFDYGGFVGLLERMNVLAIGPGLSTHVETMQFVHKVVADCPLPVVLDADGLNAFGGKGSQLKERKTPALAITPHPGEMARLLGTTTEQVQAQRLETALRAASEWNAFVILKGHRTIVATPDGRAFINSTGNPGMATGGTGDALTGMLAGLTAQFGADNWEKVLSFGVYLHGLAGDIAAAETGEAPMIASDLIRALPRAFAQVYAGLSRA